MSRTKRSKELNNAKCWNWKTKSVAHIKEGQQLLYWVDKIYVWNQEDLYDELYKIRSRHSCRRYPHYFDSWDDRYPSAIYDKHSYI